MEKKNEKIPYYEVAKQALMKWGNEESNWKGLSEVEADQIISTKSFDEIESQVYAKGSIDYAIEGIARAYKREDDEILSEEDKKELSKYIYGGEKCGIVEHWKETISQSKKSGLYSPFIMSRFDDIIIDTLFTVHDGWIKDNAKKFNSREKKHQHMPSELIGWEEAKADLLFIRPIFEKAGIEVDEKRLEKVYNRRVREFFLKHDIKTEKDLAMIIVKGEKFYPALAGYGNTLDDIKNPEIIVKKIIPQIEKNGIGKIRDVAEGIKSSELRDKKEVLVEVIRKIIKKCDNFMEKTSDISEEDYL